MTKPDAIRSGSAVGAAGSPVPHGEGSGAVRPSVPSRPVPPAGAVGADARWLARVARQLASIAGDDEEIGLEGFKAALEVKESFFAERFFALFDSDGSGTVSLEELLKALSTLAHGDKMDKLRFLFQVYDVDRGGVKRERSADAGLNLLLFALAALGHAGRGAGVPLARACSQCLNFNCAFVAVLELRRCLTRPRATWVARALPLDPAVDFHQLVGYVVAALAAVHAAAHVANFSGGGGGAGGAAGPTGPALLLLLATVLAFSTPRGCRSGRFELFYWTHLSYVFVRALLLLRGPSFWKWFAVPGCLFGLETAAGLAARRAGGLRIVEVDLLPAEVTHLVIERPPSFRRQPGDYVYLNVPAVADEWHPFSISSAPEQPGRRSQRARLRGPVAAGADGGVELTAYRAAGERAGEDAPPADLRGRNTHAKKRKKRKKKKKTSSGSRLLAGERRRFCDVQCYVDGPYGTPTRRIFASEHAVLIAAGIGVTPFASILQSIMYRLVPPRDGRDAVPGRTRPPALCGVPAAPARPGASWSRPGLGERRLGAAAGRLRCVLPAPSHVDFWINRDQKHLEWFLSLLAKLEKEQGEGEPGGRFLEMHLYMTSAPGGNDVRAVGLQMALDLLAAKEQKDSITGLRTRTQLGHPDWGQVFRKVAEEKKGKVQVFFCGSPALAKVVKALCKRFSFRFFEENF
ncbi:NADPH oxidase 5 [Rhea pennata]|uniref:NADPH oxidase 5 n=1 Tax=Rhea pennata TaxID=8795 RepID=UPI002E269387